MKKLLIFLLLSLPASASLYSERIFNQYGTPTQGTVRICTSSAIGSDGLCTALATIYSDLAMTVPKSNPFVSEVSGNFSFYAVGTFYIQITGTGIKTAWPREINLPDLGTNALKLLNGIRFADQFTGGNVGAQIDAAIADCGSNKCTVVIPSTMGAGDSTLYTVTQDGYTEVNPPSNVMLLDMRGGTSGHQIDYNSGAQSALSTLSIYHYSAAPATTSSAIIATNVGTGNLSTNVNHNGLTAEFDLTSSLTGVPNSTMGAINAESHIRSTGQTVGDLVGVKAYVSTDRTTATTNLTRATAFYAQPCANSSTSGAIISTCYGGWFGHSTAGTANYASRFDGKVLLTYYAGDNGIYWQNTGGTVFPLVKNPGTDTVAFQPLGDSAGFAFQDTAGTSNYLRVNSSGISIGTGAYITGHLSGTISADYSAWSGGDCQDRDVTVTGAASGDTVAIGVPTVLASIAGVSWTAWADTNKVTVRGCKVTSGASSDPAAATIRADVWKH